MRIIVVGGVAAGAGAAAKARRTDEKAEIVIYEKGPYISFANCGLPYYLGNTIKEMDDLLVVTPQSMKTNHNIDVFTYHEVVRINRSAKTITVHDLKDDAFFEDHYDKLIIATGARPFTLDLGKNYKNQFTLTTIPDVNAIKDHIRRYRAKSAVLVGGGYIGMETAEALRDLNINVSIVDMADQILPQFDAEMTWRIVQILKQHGVKLYLNNLVESAEGDEYIKRVKLKDGTILETDMLITTIGVIPNVKLAADAGLPINKGIIVDDMMRTADPDIYAAGDCAEIHSIVTGKNVWMPLAGPANKEGRVAGCNAAGGKMHFKGVIGTSVIKVFEGTIAKTGLSEKEVKNMGIDYVVSYTHSPNHATYYPGANTMSIKLIFDKHDGRIYGAQIAGYEGVDKRIDVLATAIYGGFSVFDLENLDLSYAPPYSSAKDPAIMAGFVAANIVRNEVQAITPQELKAMLDQKQDIQLIDVRNPKSYAAGHIPGAISIPLNKLRQKISELDRDKLTVICCQVGHTSYNAYKILINSGFKNVRNLSGGYSSWIMM